jgi:SNF2 family DNA or RNA helicase
MGGFGGYEVVGYRYMDELQNKLSEIMVRRLKEDVFDLPEKTFVDEYVDMTKDQEKIYKEVQTDLKQNIDKIASAINPLSELIRLRQATGYTGILSTSIQESAKLDRMAEIVEEAISNNRKVVIFSNWTQMTDAIDYRLASIKMPDTNAYMSAYTALITGDTKDEHRQDIVNAFQTTNDIRILVGTIGAMGTGLTLTAGTVVIFLDHPWTRALYDQAVDRCHRIGQKNNITIYNIMCKNTIDERIWSIVKTKGQMSDQIVDGKISGNKTELINYLLG